MAPLKLRDRDAIVTREGLIFRVFGYSHPSNAYICDAEYVPEAIFKSTNPRAFRNCGKRVFYKFYEDEGWKLINTEFPQYMIFHEMLDRRVVGVDCRDITGVRKPREMLESLVETEPGDELHRALQKVVKLAVDSLGLSTGNFGVFGSLLYGFYHPKFSDIDLIVYGGKNITQLRQVLEESYDTETSRLKNEFETDFSIRGKNWRFKNYSAREFLWHQRRKLIYALFKSESGRTIKTEFEPVKEWEEIVNDYDSGTRILQKGWTKISARVVNDADAPFIPSVYAIEPIRVLAGPKEGVETKRVISYMEEFRMQVKKDETVYLEGNLEKVMAPEDSFYQVALTYCPRYYEQVLKVEPQLHASFM